MSATPSDCGPLESFSVVLQRFITDELIWEVIPFWSIAYCLLALYATLKAAQSQKCYKIVFLPPLWCAHLFFSFRIFTDLFFHGSSFSSLCCNTVLIQCVASYATETDWLHSLEHGGWAQLAGSFLRSKAEPGYYHGLLAPWMACKHEWRHPFDFRNLIRWKNKHHEMVEVGFLNDSWV